MTRFISLIILFGICLGATAAAGFTFSGYEERQKELNGPSGAGTEKPTAVNCPEGYTSQRIALIIAEEAGTDNWRLRQNDYRPFYQEINRRLQDLGLRTYSPAEIEKQIARREIKALMQGDTGAALNASRQLEASYFIKGHISSQTRLNRLVGIQEVYVSMNFTLTDAGGRIISQTGIDSTAFSGADTMASALRLVRNNADRIVAELHRDFCQWLRDNRPERLPARTAESLQEDNDKSTASSKATGDPGPETSPDRKDDSKVRTIVVSAEGLADPSSETYKGDRGLLIDALRRDARRQAIEKAVGTFVDSSTLVENFTVINDRVLTRSSGLIKRIIKQSAPWQGKDGLMHLLIKAEVFIADVEAAISELSENQRIQLIRESGNPTISVAVMVRDAARGSTTPMEHSAVAENILKEKFKDFGFRVWSEDYSRRLQGDFAGNRRQADFSVIGEAKFARRDLTLPGSGTGLTRHILTSWVVKCLNNHTGEEIYFSNQIPTEESWDNEDRALREIGRLIGEEFNRDFFSNYLTRPSTTFRMEITGLPDYDTALLIKKDMVGLRPVLNVDIREFSSPGLSVFEVDFAGSRANFSQIINNTVLKPINAKLGAPTLQLTDRHGNVIRIAFRSDLDRAAIKNRLESMPPASLAKAAPERINSLVSNKDVLNKIKKLNPGYSGEAVQTSGQGGTSLIRDF